VRPSWLATLLAWNLDQSANVFSFLYAEILTGPWSYLQFRADAFDVINHTLVFDPIRSISESCR